MRGLTQRKQEKQAEQNRRNERVAEQVRELRHAQQLAAIRRSAASAKSRSEFQPSVDPARHFSNQPSFSIEQLTEMNRKHEEMLNPELKLARIRTEEEYERFLNFVSYGKMMNPAGA
jgi:hypothetical protein